MRTAQSRRVLPGLPFAITEQLDVLAGSRPLVVDEEVSKEAEEGTPEAMAAKEPVKAQMMQLLKQKYGFDEEARSLAEKTVLLFGRDLEQNGCLHEYYYPDTCEPIVTHGFENWNYLVLNMIAWLENRPFVDTF